MVNNVNSNRAYAYPKQDLQNLAKYATGMDVTPQKNNLKVTDLMSYPMTITAYDSYQWIKKNKGNYKAAFKTITDTAQEGNKLLKQVGVNGVLRVSNAKDILKFIPESEYLSKLSQPVQDLYKTAQSYAEIAIKTPEKAKRALKVANKNFAEAKAAAYAEKTASATGIFSKVKNALGITKVNKGLNNLAAKSPTFSKCLDAYKNESGTLMLALEGGIEVATNVVPTFKKLGAKKGLKQLGKSSVTTASSVAGWVAGSAIGSKVGKAIKAAVPGGKKAGALIGVLAETVCSYVGGSIVQHFASKGAKKLVGKSELEKAKEQETLQLTQVAQDVPEVFNGLIEAAAQRMSVEGENSPNSKAMNESFKNLVLSQQPSAILDREQLAMVAKSLEDPQVQTVASQRIQQQAGMQTSERATQAIANADAYMNKLSKTVLK